MIGYCNFHKRTHYFDLRWNLEFSYHSVPIPYDLAILAHSCFRHLVQDYKAVTSVGSNNNNNRKSRGRKSLVDDFSRTEGCRLLKCHFSQFSFLCVYLTWLKSEEKKSVEEGEQYLCMVLFINTLCYGTLPRNDTMSGCVLPQLAKFSHYLLGQGCLLILYQLLFACFLPTSLLSANLSPLPPPRFLKKKGQSLTFDLSASLCLTSSFILHFHSVSSSL